MGGGGENIFSVVIVRRGSSIINACLVKLNNNINKPDYCCCKRFHFNLKLYKNKIHRYRLLDKKASCQTLFCSESLYWKTNNLFSFIFKYSLGCNKVWIFDSIDICNLIQTFLIVFHFKLGGSTFSYISECETVSCFCFCSCFCSCSCNRLLMILLIRYSLVRH